MALVSGASLILRHPQALFSGPELLTQMRQQEVSLALLPPSLMSLLDATELSTLRSVVSVGEKCSAEAVARWSAAGRSFFNGYGPAEATVTVSAYLVDQHAQPGPPPIGRPLANVQLYVLDSHLQPVPIGVPGELYIGGLQLARGYLNQPALTAEKFIPNPFSAVPGARLYRTGDITRYLPDGNLEFVGRRDYQVKIRGYRVELGEIEAALNDYPGVRESIVLPYGGADTKTLVAYLIGAPELQAQTQQMRQALKTKLPDYMVPAAFIRLEEWPRTSNGKVDRQALPLPDGAGAEIRTPFVAPSNAVEQSLAEIFSEVLRIKQVGIDDNFFDLGGHSLCATMVIVRVKQALHVELPLRKLFELPTIRELSEFLKTNVSKP
jgi:acyl-coenzyme A synthetase/AMP-(fatty) acid ligase/acyl carrier protein